MILEDKKTDFSRSILHLKVTEESHMLLMGEFVMIPNRGIKSDVYFYQLPQSSVRLEDY